MAFRAREYVHAFLPAVLWLVVIMIFSNSWASAGTTEKIIIFVLQLIHVTPTRELVHALNHLARTAAHLVLYSVFAMLIWRGFERLPARPRLTTPRLLAVVLLIVATCAAGDELHQWKLGTRGGSVRDVFLDSSGGMIGLFLGWIYRRRSPSLAD